MPSSLATVLSLSLGYSPRPPVSVLVRAAYELTLEAFLETWYHKLHYLVACSLGPQFELRTRIFLCTIYICVLPNPIRAIANLVCHSIISYAGAGISTCSSSTTPFGLALVPDLPREDEPSPGNLGHTLCKILTYISLLTPAFSLPNAPALLTVYLQRCLERSPTPCT